MPRPPRVTPASGPRPALTRHLGLLVLAAACAQQAPVPEDLQRPAAANEHPVPEDIPEVPEAVPADSSHVLEDIHAPSATASADSPHTPQDRHPALDTPVPEDISYPPRLASPPPGLVDLRAELPGACFDVRYATADNFTGAVLPGYAAAGAWLRPRPAGALAKVQAAVSAEGLTLLVYDAYRPARASLAMVEWAERSGRRQLVDDGYIARRSGHNRGDTLDLTLARPGTCEPLDMGTAWDHFGPESHYARAGGDALAHRRQLRRAMQAQGFTPYDKEWWHFTFHDPDAAALDIPYQPAP